MTPRGLCTMVVALDGRLHGKRWPATQTRDAVPPQTRTVTEAQGLTMEPRARPPRTIRWGTCIAATLVVTLVASLLWAEPTQTRGIDEAFRLANEAYARGDYTAAVEGYERVASLGIVHEDLYYNLGNAYYKLGKFGLSIYNYERALALDPDQPDARRNLEIARAQAERLGRDKVEGALKEPFWARAVTWKPRATLLYTFLGVYYAFFALLFGLRFMRPGLGRAAVGTGVVLFGLATVLAGSLFFGRLAHDSSVRYAIVLPDEVAVREGPSQGAAQAFRLHAGLKVRLVEEDQGWVRIRLANGLEGWIQGRDVGRL